MSERQSLNWRLGNKLIDCTRPRVMAVLNADPESFFSASRIDSHSAELRYRLQLLLDSGPDILDIGGQSTRPGSTAVGAEEELRRVVPVIAAARELAPELPITVDTYHSVVAREALAAGADGVNDISAARFDPALLDVVAASGCGYVLMHMLGVPETMQQAPAYSDCVAEVGAFLAQQLALLAARGIGPERVAIDPGIGFGKRLEDNLELIRGVDRLRLLIVSGQDPLVSAGVVQCSTPGRSTAAPPLETGTAAPLLYGISRKSFIGKVMAKAGLPGSDDPAQRLPGTLALTWTLLEQGVMLHRVHDVAETRQVIALWEALRKVGPA